MLGFRRQKRWRIGSGKMSSTVSPAVASGTHVGATSQTLLSVFYVVGVGANALALALLARHESARSRRQTLLLRCLVTSDLLALMGSFVLMHLQSAASSVARTNSTAGMISDDDAHAFCIARVAWRAFGLGSGAVSQVMAAERWMALNRPFFYQKHVTARALGRAVAVLWLLVAILSALPFLGLGLYFDQEAAPGQKCVRYRFATKPADVAYAYLVFAFGLLLCTSIVGCNIGVMRALWQLRARRISHVPRRLSSSRASTGSNSASGTGATTAPNVLHWEHHATREEVAFARLMGVISVAFVACWIPQLATIIAAQVDPKRRQKPLYRVADVAIALNFVLDPFLYVVLRARARRAIARVVKGQAFCPTFCTTKSPSRDFPVPLHQANNNNIAATL